ncbi:MAG: RDD family protein [Archangiaceae bacterium]|nr:RDD family protein [Archangiaceae bacterium]
MQPASAIGSCFEHADRPGTPCLRCGTFRCAECLGDGLCPRCRDVTLRPVTSDDVVGFGPRAGARIIDMVAGYVAGTAAGVLAAIVLGILQAVGAAQPGWLQRFGHGFVFNLLVGTVAAIAAHSVATVVCGASIGKALLKLRVVRTDGRRLGVGQALIRESVYLVDAFFFGLVGKSAMDSSSLQQRHGDRLADAAVVRADAVSRDSASTGGRLAGGLLAGMAVHVVVLAAFFVAGAM